MDPKLNEVVWFLDGFDLGYEETLENVGQVSHIELVVEVNGSLPEVSLYFSMQCQSSFDDRHNLFLDGSLELGEVLAEESIIDGEEGSLLREGNSQSPEMSLKSSVDLERTSCGVHTSCVLGVLNIFKLEL